MTFSTHALLMLVAVIIYAVAFGLLLLGDPKAKVITEMLFLGLAFHAGGHVLP